MIRGAVMKKRIITGIIGLAFLVLVLYLSTFTFNLFMATISAIAVCEMFRAVGVGRFKSINAFGVMAVVVYIFSVAYNKPLIQPLVSVYLFLLFMLFMTKVEGIGYKHISKAFMATMFVGVLFGHLSLIRGGETGRFGVWMVLVISFLTDTFAYFVGKFIGKHKFAPKLSPKKTIEGAFGGLVGAIVGMLVYCMLLDSIWGFEANRANAIIIAIIGSVVSQIGDLAASAVKRQYSIKDYGKVLPGHGGIMDRFDGVLFAAPAVYYLLMFFPVI